MRLATTTNEDFFILIYQGALLPYDALYKINSTLTYQKPLTTRSYCMFPEYRDLITKLKHSDLHFTQLFDKHNALDQKIKNMETRVESGTLEEIENLKKEKLLLKDQIYTHLKNVSVK
jgi:hypothetical protein